uniref:Uncharacterized protein n=1 Tax=Cyanoderma ruficeps TaxID=181631 RepID=A0A8C3R3J6_9PASS
ERSQGRLRLLQGDTLGVIPSRAATIRSLGAAARARGGWSWGHQITRSAWGKLRTGGQGLSPPGMAEQQRGWPWISSVAVGAQCGARRCVGQCSGAGRAMSGARAGARKGLQ